MGWMPQEAPALGAVSYSLDSCCSPTASEPITAETAAEIAAASKALGDPVRVRLLAMIAAAPAGEICVCELTPLFDLSGPTISHHLRLLRESGLVTSQRRGTWVYYKPVRARLVSLSRQLQDIVLR